MFGEIMIFVLGLVVGAIITAIWPKARTWSDKQGASISKRWVDLRADYDQFSSTARAEFEDIEERARLEIAALKAKYRK